MDPITFRPTTETRRMLDSMIERMQINQSAVINLALTRLYREEIDMKTSRTKIKPVDVYLDGEYIGTANEIITNRTGAYYAVDGEYLQDNGEYIPVGGYGVETK